MPTFFVGRGSPWLACAAAASLAGWGLMIPPLGLLLGIWVVIHVHGHEHDKLAGYKIAM